MTDYDDKGRERFIRTEERVFALPGAWKRFEPILEARQKVVRDARVEGGRLIVSTIHNAQFYAGVSDDPAEMERMLSEVSEA